MRTVATYVYPRNGLRTCASAINLKPKDSLPDPKGSMSSRLSSQRSLLLSKWWKRSLTARKAKARPIHVDHGPARFQASGGGRIAESMTSVASCSIDASFCLVFKKINATNFRSSSFAVKNFSLAIKLYNTKRSRCMVYEYTIYKRPIQELLAEEGVGLILHHGLIVRTTRYSYPLSRYSRRNSNILNDDVHVQICT